MIFGIIGGTGVYGLEGAEEKTLENEYGKVVYSELKYGDHSFIFMTRHGNNHTIPPHKVNFRANIKAMKDLGVEEILSTAAVGSCNPNFEPGSLVILDDFIDFTKSRQATFFDGIHNDVRHIEMSHPFCRTLKRDLLEIASKEGVKLLEGGIYATTEGPRFETPAEIKFYSMIGANLVGMTVGTEATLARELGICYESVAIVVNWCSGIEDNIDDSFIQKAMGENKRILTDLFIKCLAEKRGEKICSCQNPYI